MKIEAKLFAGAAVGALAASACAGPEWEEPMGALNDAGETPATAQFPAGLGAIGRIRGELSGVFPRAGLGGPVTAEDFQDVYVIFINDPQEFVATTDGALFGDATFDPSLYLFFLDGEGLLANNEAPNATPPDRASLPNESNDNTNVQLMRRGLYLLAIAGTGNEPVAQDPFGALRIFQFTMPFEVSGPDGPGGVNGLPFDDWAGQVMMGTYDIRLQGVKFPPLCPGDVNCDGVTNTEDITFAVSNLGSTGRRGLVPGDADLDGETTVADITFIVSNLGCDAELILADLNPSGGGAGDSPGDAGG